MSEHARRPSTFALLVVLAIVGGWTLLFAVTDWSTRAHLTVIGVTLEVIGVALVAMDFWPAWAVDAVTRGRRWTGEHIHRLTGYLRARARHLAVKLRRRKTVTAQTVGINPAIETNVAGTVTPKIERGQSLAAMVRQLHEFDARLKAVEARQEDDAREVDDRLDALAADVQEWIRRSKDQYLGWRIIGLVVALTGAGFLAAANLV
jgi:hypothetical protein